MPLASTKVGHSHHLTVLLCRAVSWLRWADSVNILICKNLVRGSSVEKQVVQIERDHISYERSEIWVNVKNAFEDSSQKYIPKLQLYMIKGGYIVKSVTTSQGVKYLVITKKLFARFFFILVVNFVSNLSFWVLSQFEFLSFVTIWVSEFFTCPIEALEV